MRRQPPDTVPANAWHIMVLWFPVLVVPPLAPPARRLDRRLAGQALSGGLGDALVGLVMITLFLGPVAYMVAQGIVAPREVINLGA